MAQNDGWEDVSHELKGESDGWEDVSHEISPKKNSGFDAETALRGYGDSLTLGYRNNLQAATEPLITKTLNFLTGNDVPSDDVFDSDAYVKRRDAVIKETEKMKADNPGSYYTGMGVGAVNTAFLPGLNAAKGASALARVGRAAGAGATMGAIANPGETEGEFSGLQVGDRLKNATVGAVLGGTLQGAGEVASKAFNGAKSLGEFLKSNPKANAEEIKAAAKSLGTEATPGMIDNGGYVERLEQSLSESPSYWGRKVNKSIKDVYEKSNKVSDDLLSGATNMSPYQLGEKVKSGIASSVGERAAPISMVFDDVAQATKNIPLSERSVDAFKRNIQNMDGFKLLGNTGKGKSYLEALDRLENANDVKTLMTMLGQDIASSDGADRAILQGIKEKLGNLEKNSITRAAIQSAKNSGEGADVAMDIIGDLKDARQSWRVMLDDYRGVSHGARLPKANGPDAFINSIESIPSERIQDKLFNVNDQRSIESLKKVFPTEFDLLKSGKLKDILDVAQLQGETNAKIFLKEAGKLNPEAQSILFGKEVGKIGQLETVSNAMPKNFNPSGTSSQSMWNFDALKSNVTDIPRFAAYKFSSNPASDKLAQTLVSSSPRFAEMAKTNPQAFSLMVQNLAQNPKFQKAQQQSPAPQQGPTLDRLGNDPRRDQFLKNERIKEMLKKRIEQRKIKDRVPIEEAQASFVQNN